VNRREVECFGRAWLSLPPGIGCGWGLRGCLVLLASANCPRWVGAGAGSVAPGTPDGDDVLCSAHRHPAGDGSRQPPPLLLDRSLCSQHARMGVLDAAMYRLALIDEPCARQTCIPVVHACWRKMHRCMDSGCRSIAGDTRMCSRTCIVVWLGVIGAPWRCMRVSRSLIDALKTWIVVVAGLVDV
jgi:hypothetical protein